MITRRFLFRFLFHPASMWSEPYQREEMFEAPDEATARRYFEMTWYRNVSNETCEEIT